MNGSVAITPAPVSKCNNLAGWAPKLRFCLAFDSRPGTRYPGQLQILLSNEISKQSGNQGARHSSNNDPIFSKLGKDK